METKKDCFCNGSRPWFRTASSDLSHPVRLIGYARAESPDAARLQFMKIEEFCQENNYELVERYYDIGGQPGAGLGRAIKQLSHANGLIACDLEQFVCHHQDRLMDLKPLLHKFFCSGTRFLLTIKEGVNTQSAAGQHAAIEVLNSLKDPMQK